jgi:hypothetical protein
MADTYNLDRRFTVLLDRRLVDAIRAASSNKYTRPSAYIREAVVDRLRAEGVVISPSTVESLEAA